MLSPLVESAVKYHCVLDITLSCIAHRSKLVLTSGPPTKAAIKPASRPVVDDAPSATFLTSVGNISGV